MNSGMPIFVNIISGCVGIVLIWTSIAIIHNQAFTLGNKRRGTQRTVQGVGAVFYGFVAFASGLCCLAIPLSAVLPFAFVQEMADNALLAFVIQGLAQLVGLLIYEQFGRDKPKKKRYVEIERR